MKTIVVWFRRDLRLQDNPALSWAAGQQAAILPVYIHSPEEEAPWEPGAASRWWLHNSLLELEAALARRGLALRCYLGNAAEILPALVRCLDLQALAANRVYAPHLAQRDQRVQETLSGLGVENRFFDSALLLPPGSLLNRQGQPYRVFTPFWRQARHSLELAPPGPGDLLPPGRLPAGRDPDDAGGDVISLGLLDAHTWHEKLHCHWQPGEQAAQRRLEAFCADGLQNYRDDRQYPALQGSSRLSPHLHFGEITPAQIWRRLMPMLMTPDPATSASMETFISELGWREFAHHVLWHFPHTSQESMNTRFKDSFWNRDDTALAAWQNGSTGVPLIDAGMRELWETGWMHNRVRMLVGSFLTKNLGIHWREGARWFWDTLVDADLANNSLGWQWIAGCGVDAAPYYRIFNPQTQAQKYDPNGEYVSRWLEYRLDTPPIVELAESRSRALARYKQL